MNDVKTNENTIVKLIGIVSTLCQVSEEEMFGAGTLHCCHARWLFWYSYRRLTNATFSQISEVTKEVCGKKFCGQSIGHAVTRMSQMFDTDKMWHARWQRIKADFDSDIDSINNKNVTRKKIVISIPKEIKEIIDIKYV